jgi:hypothetical protein
LSVAYKRGVIREMSSLQDARIEEFEIEVKKRGGNGGMDWRENNSHESCGTQVKGHCGFYLVFSFL